MVRISPNVRGSTVTLAIVGVVVVVSVAVIGSSGRVGGQQDIEVRTTDHSALWPPPERVEEFANRMTSVVVGHYVEVLDVREGDPTSAVGADLRLPVTVMRFEIDRYLVGTGPSSLAIGQYGDIPAGFTLFGMPAPQFGEEITMIVTPWSLDPSISHPVFNTYGRLVERDGVVQYAFVTPELVEELPAYRTAPFAEGKNLREVQAQLQQAARDRGMAVSD